MGTSVDRLGGLHQPGVVCAKRKLSSVAQVVLIVRSSVRADARAEVRGETGGPTRDRIVALADGDLTHRLSIDVIIAAMPFSTEPLVARSPVLSVCIVMLVAAGAGVLAWFAFLGWHHDGDYNAWASIGFALALVVVTAIPAWLGAALGAAAGVSVALTATVMFSLDASTRPETADANMWPIGAGFLLFGALGGLALVVAIVRSVANTKNSNSTI